MVKSAAADTTGNTTTTPSKTRRPIGKRKAAQAKESRTELPQETRKTQTQTTECGSASSAASPNATHSTAADTGGNEGPPSQNSALNSLEATKFTGGNAELLAHIEIALQACGEDVTAERLLKALTVNSVGVWWLAPLSEEGSPCEESPQL